MSKNSKVPNAWDDDWESQADQIDNGKHVAAEQSPVPRTERLARHAEAQRKLWESAESPQENHFVAATSNVPLATTFKPAMKVLSRKPAPQLVAKKDPITGVEQMTLQDDEEEEIASKKNQPSPEEIRMRQQKELEEKQRRYEEVRAKIFGDSTTSSGRSTPGNVTPPAMSDARQAQRKPARGRGGSFRGNGRQDIQQDSQGRRTPTGGQNSPRELYDPNYAFKPGGGTQRRDVDGGLPKPGRSGTPREEDQVIRAPLGPDSSGRGGFKFARRGAKDG